MVTESQEVIQSDEDNEESTDIYFCFINGDFTISGASSI